MANWVYEITDGKKLIYKDGNTDLITITLSADSTSIDSDNLDASIANFTDTLITTSTSNGTTTVTVNAGSTDVASIEVNKTAKYALVLGEGTEVQASSYDIDPSSAATEVTVTGIVDDDGGYVLNDNVATFYASGETATLAKITGLCTTNGNFNVVVDENGVVTVGKSALSTTNASTVELTAYTSNVSWKLNDDTNDTTNFVHTTETAEYAWGAITGTGESANVEYIKTPYAYYTLSGNTITCTHNASKAEFKLEGVSNRDFLSDTYITVDTTTHKVTLSASLITDTTSDKAFSVRDTITEYDYTLAIKDSAGNEITPTSAPAAQKRWVEDTSTSGKYRYESYVAAYYGLSNDKKTLTYHAESPTTLAEISGLESGLTINADGTIVGKDEIIGITENTSNSTVTGYTINVASSLLSGEGTTDGQVTFTTTSNGFNNTLQIDSQAVSASAETANEAWEVVEGSTNATYKATTVAYFIQNGNVANGVTTYDYHALKVEELAILSGPGLDLTKVNNDNADVTLFEGTTNKYNITLNKNVFLSDKEGDENYSQDFYITLEQGSNAGSNSYTLKLDTTTADKVATESTVSYAWKENESNNQQADYIKSDTTYYTTNGTNVERTLATTTTLATITGLKAGFQLGTGEGKDGEITTTETTDNNVTTVKAVVANTLLDSAAANTGDTVSLSDEDTSDAYEFKLVISGIKTSTFISKRWVTTTEADGTVTATYQSVNGEYYTKDDGTTYTLTKETSTDLVTISGLKAGTTATDGKISGISVNNKKITLSDTALFDTTTNSAVNIVGDSNYTFEISGLNAVTTGTPNLDYASVIPKGEAYVKGDLTDGYAVTDNGKSVNYYAARNDVTLATIYGLDTVYADKNENGTINDDIEAAIVFDADNNKITLKQDALKNSDVKLSVNEPDYYSCQLVITTSGDGKVDTIASDTYGWTVNGTTANYQYWKDEKWELSDSHTITYTGITELKNLAVISGLDSNIETSGTSLGKTVDNNFFKGVDVNDDHNIFTFLGSTTSKANILGANVNLTKSADDNKEYKLALGTGITTSTAQTSATDFTWSVSGQAATHNQAYSAGYELVNDTTIENHADSWTKVIANLTGLASGQTSETLKNAITYDNGTHQYTVTKSNIFADAVNNVVSLTNPDGTKGNLTGLQTEIQTSTSWAINTADNASTSTATYSLITDARYNYDPTNGQYTLASLSTTNPLLTIDGVISGLTAGTATSKLNDVYASVDTTQSGTALISIDGYKVNINGAALPTNPNNGDTFSINFNNTSYSLSDSVVTTLAPEQGSAYSWTSVTNADSAMYKVNVTPGYDYNNGTFTYNSSTEKTLLTIAGLNAAALNQTAENKINGIEFGTGNKSNTIVLDSTVLASSTINFDITLSGVAGYNIDLASNITTAPSVVKTWSGFDYRSNTSAFYTDNGDTSISYTAATNPETIFTISGLKTGLNLSGDDSSTVTVAGTVIKLTDGALETNAVVSTTNAAYTFNIDALTADKTSDYLGYGWATDENGSATYRHAYDAGYVLSNTGHSLVYRAAGSDTEFSISGLKGTDYSSIRVEGIYNRGQVTGYKVILPETLLGTDTITITGDNNYQLNLALADGIATSAKDGYTWKVTGNEGESKTAVYLATNSAFYTIGNGTITYNSETEKGAIFSIDNLKAELTTTTNVLGNTAINGITISGSTVTLSNSVFGTYAHNAEITLNDEDDTDGKVWSIALGKDVDTVIGFGNKWDANAGSATYYQQITDAGYKKQDSATIVYSALNGTETLTTLTGILSSVTDNNGAISDIAVNGTTFTLGKGVLGTDTVNVDSNKYTLAVGTDADLKHAVDNRSNVWVYGQSATYREVTPEYYYTTNGTTINYQSETYGNANITITGINYNDALKDTFTKLFNSTTLKGNVVTLTAEMFGDDANSLIRGDNGGATLNITSNPQSAYKGATFAFAEGDGIPEQKFQSTEWEAATDGNNPETATLIAHFNRGVTLDDAHTTMTYSNAYTSTYAVLTGLETGDNGSTLSSITFSGEDSKTLVLGSSVLSNTNVYFSSNVGGYKLSIGSDVPSVGTNTFKDWVFTTGDSTGTASFNTFSDQWYELIKGKNTSNDSITYHAQKEKATEVAKITGLSSNLTADTVYTSTLNNKSYITLKAEALNSETVTLTNKNGGNYILQSGTNVTATITDPKAWGGSAGTATFVANVHAGYTFTNNKVTYTSESTLTYATITGLNANGDYSAGITFTDKNSTTIRLGSTLLDGKDITLDKGASAGNTTYKFDTLDTNTFAPVKVLGKSGKAGYADNTFNWTADVTSGYTLANTKTFIDYTSETTKVLASISGLKEAAGSTLTATLVEGTYTFTLTPDMLSETTVTLIDKDENDEYNFKLALSNDVVKSDVKVVGTWSSDTKNDVNTTAIYGGYKPAYYNLNANGTGVSYKGQEEQPSVLTITGLKSDWLGNVEDNVKMNTGTNVITIAGSVLTANSSVQLTGSGYKLAIGEGANGPEQFGSETFYWKAGSNYAYLTADVSSGFSLFDSSKRISYVASTTNTLATIQGLTSNTELLSAEGAITKEYNATSGIMTLTFSDTVLQGKSISITDNISNDSYTFKLALADGINTSTSLTHDAWTFSSGTVTHNLYRDAYYTTDTSGLSISFTKEAVQKQLATITGLNTNVASGTGVFTVSSVNNSNTITLGATALTASDVSLIGSGYKLQLDGVDLREQSDYSLSTGTGKGYLTAMLDSGYTLADDFKSITYSGNTETLTLATISGIDTSAWNAGNGITYTTNTGVGATNTIVLSSNVLTGKSVSVIGNYGYELDLGAGIATEAAVVNEWQLEGSNKTPIFYAGNTSGFYSDTGKNISYVAGAQGTKQVTINGLNLTGQTYTVSNTSIGNASIGYSDTTGFVTGFTFNEASHLITISDASILPTVNNAKVTFTNLSTTDTYTFGLDASITAPSETSSWYNVTGGTTSKNAEFQVAHTAGYTLASNSSTITHSVAGTDTFFTLSGLSTSYVNGTSDTLNGITIYLDGSEGDKDKTDGKDTVKLSADALGTSPVSITSKGSKEYVLDIDTGVDGVNIANDKYEYKWIVDGTTARYSKVRTAYYSIGTDGKINYTAESVVATLATVTGLNKGLDVLNNGASLGKTNESTLYITIDNTYGDNGEINGGTVKIENNAALSNSTAKITSGTGYSYEFATLGDSVAKPTATTTGEGNGWSVTGTTASLKGSVTEGYTLAGDSKSITYSAEKAAGSTILTISGIKAGTTGDDIASVTNGNTITLTQDMLGTSKVTISNQNYKLALDGEVPTKAVNKTFWTSVGTVLTYQNGDTEYYTYDKDTNSITYTKPDIKATYLTITGSALESNLPVKDGLIDGIMVDNDSKQVILSNSVFVDTKSNGQKVTISGKSGTGYDYTTYTLALAPEVATPKTGDPSWTKGANATSAIYTADVTAGYNLASDNKSISYATNTTKTYATLAGLKTATTADDLKNNVIINTATEGDKSTNTVVLNSTILAGTTKVAIKGTGYVLGVDDEVNTDSTNTTKVWSTQGTTAYYQTVIPEYYSVTSNAITKVNKKTTKTLATITGLSSSVTTTNGEIPSGITLTENEGEDNVITLAEGAIPKSNNATVKLSGSGYKLALANGLNAPAIDDDSKSWSVNNGKAILSAKSGAGYVLATDNKSVTYKTALTEAAPIVTVSGLSTNVNNNTLSSCLTLGADNVITLKKDALGTGTVAVNNSAYKLALDTEVMQEAKVSDYWTVSGSTVTYQTGTGEYYEYVEKNNSIVYHKPVSTTKDQLFQIIGLKAGLKAFTTVDGEGVIGDGTNVYATVRQIGTENGNDVMLVTLTKDALPEAKNGAKVVITDKNSSDKKIYKVAFDDSKENGVNISEKGEATWVVSGNTATYCIPESEGYKFTDSTSTTAVYSAATSTVLATITGLNNKLTISDEEKAYAIQNYGATKGTAEEIALKYKMEAYLNDNTVVETGTSDTIITTLPPEILANTNVGLSDNNAKDKYLFRIALDADVPQADATTNKGEAVTGWNVTGTTANSTANYQTYNKAFYTLNANANKVTCTKDTAPQTLITVSGLKSGLTVTNGLVGSKYGEISGITIDDDAKKVYLSESALPESPVANSRVTISGLKANSGTDYSKYQLQLDDDSLKATNNDDEAWAVSGSSLVLRDDISAGYNISTDGKTLTYAAAKSSSAAPAIVTITGLNLNVTAAEIKEYQSYNTNVDSATAKTKIQEDRISENISISDDTITLKTGILGTSNVTLTNGTKGGTKSTYKLALDTDVNQKSGQETREWVINGTTAYYRYFEEAYYTSDTAAAKITYTAPKNSKNLITLNGLKSGLTVEDKKIDGITLDGTVVKLSSDVLTTSNVSISGIQNGSDDYRKVTLAIDNDVDTEAYQNTAWTVNGTTATYKTYETGYYTLNTSTSKAITYTREKTLSTLATVTGLKSGTTADQMTTAFDGSNITLTGDMVGTTNVKLTNGKDSEGNKQEFKLVTGTGVVTATTDTSTWSVSNTTATNKTYKNGYFSQISDESWTYTPDTNATDTIVISGLRKDLTVDQINRGITIADDKKTVTITNDDLLNNTTVSLTGKGAYSATTLALSTTATNANMSTPAYSLSGSSILYTAYNQNAYYKANTTDTTKVKSYTYRAVNADKPTLFTINGLNVNVTAAEIKAAKEAAANDGNTLTDAQAKEKVIQNRITAGGIIVDADTKKVTLKKDMLGTAKTITLTQGKNELGTTQAYYLALDTGVPTKAVENTTSWSVSGTNANYNKYTAGFYTLDTGDKPLKVTYTADTNKETLATVTGLKSGLTATNGAIDGISLSTGDNAKVITLDKSVLGTAAKVALNAAAIKDGYKLALDTTNADTKKKVNAVATPLAWNTNTSKTATYSNENGFYTLTETDTAVTYTAGSKHVAASVTVNKENILLGDDNIKENDISIQINDNDTENVKAAVVLAKADVGNNTSFNINGNSEYAFSFASDVATATVTGAATADTIKAEGKNMTFNTAAGDDVINATGSITLISAGAGNDKIIYNPTTANTFAGRINGDADSDTIYVGANAGGNLTISGGAGVDSINVAGTGKNRILGEADSDTIIVSGGGDNTIYGGAGHDYISIAGGGSNLVYGDADSDTIVVSGNGDNTIYGGAGVDSINVTGTGNNVIYGDAGADKIVVGGDATNNTYGNNIIYGGDGDDDISVSGGANTITGGKNDDKITLGGGADVVIYANGDGNDEIVSFTKGTDNIKITSGTVGEIQKDKSNNIIINVGTGKITLKGAATQYTGTEDKFTYIDSKGASVEKSFTTASADLAEDLAESADLIYGDDDVFFGSSGISELVNNSFDNYSLGDLPTQGIKELTPQEDILTYGNDENTNK
ncbi:MAG: hypothetical protein IKZ58_00745 [Selenomonadaceae bacterium]|nr:hypothetical protein [Selenomonadaceae bacterium]